jgi:hypothetical protein
MKRAERPFKTLPVALLAGFLIILLIQLLVVQFSLSRYEPVYKPLSAPLAASTYRIVAMGSDQLMGFLLSIRLQLHDNQSGKHIRYEQLNYRALIDWLDQIVLLNVQSEYPTMLASRVYGQTNDQKKLRIMVDFIQRSFTQDPQRHWRRMTEATILAKHKLGDLELALSIAEQLSSQPADIVMPHWARDMQFILLGDMNEFEAGKAIIAALLESVAIVDLDEQRFLKGKLLDFQQKLLEIQQQ